MGTLLRSRGDLGMTDSHPAVLREDGSLVVPAEVALCWSNLLPLLGAVQGVRAVGAEEFAAFTDTQSSFDGARIHAAPPPLAWVCGSAASAVSIGRNGGSLEVRKQRGSQSNDGDKPGRRPDVFSMGRTDVWPC